ncbi:MAG: 30S ribosomal protein S7 [Promethearchaeia archaeon]|nr:MAG: 30S ribosomal protein S7 [Candidatus Lokiarchaeia archaeon]
MVAKRKSKEEKAEEESNKADSEEKELEEAALENLDEENENPSEVLVDEIETEEESEEEADEESKKKRTRRQKAQIKLFNRWSYEGVEVHDISLQNYINLEPVIIPHSGGKHQHKRFWKTEHISIIERFINKIMTPGLVKKRIKGRGSSQNMGKKQKIIRIVYNAFAIVEQKTGENPIQVLINAIENVAPREETTRISLGGISYQQAVDIAPQRRVDLSLKLLVQATVGKAYNNIKTIDELLANELILASRNDTNSAAVKRKDEMERVAISAR